MDFKQLRSFRSVATTLNFSKSANLLNYVQSAVTAHIRSLEADLNVQLFDRSGRKVRLTAAGERLLKYTDQLFALRDQARLAMVESEEIKGELIVAGYETVITYYLPEIIHTFTDTHPGVHLRMTSLNVNTLGTQVSDHHIDVAFILGEESFNPNIEARCIGRENIVFIASPSHPLAAGQDVKEQNLAEETILLTEPGCNYRRELEQTLKVHQVHPSRKMEFISIEAIKACVKLGVGIAAISESSVKKELASGELVALNWQGKELFVNIYMIWNGKRWLSPAIKAFLEFADQ